LTILVTGGLGFIGSRLTRELVAREEEILVLDISSDTSRLSDLIDEVKLVQADVSDQSEVLSVVKGNDVRRIFHLAALLTLDCAANPVRAYKTNVEGTVNILEVARLMDVREVVFPSTRAVFGTWNPEPLEDDSPKDPTSFYGATKLLCEFYGYQYWKTYGVDFCAARLVMAFGPGRKTGGSAFGSRLIEDPFLGKPVNVPYDAMERTDWLFVQDAVKALLMMSEASLSDRRIYNINGETHTLAEVAELVKREVPGAEFIFTPGPVPLSKTYPLLDDRRARRELNWTPSFSTAEGIRETIRELKKRTNVPAL